MAQWLALSDRATPLEAALGLPLLVKATLVLEFELPLEGAAILIDYKTDTDWPRALSVFVDEQAGVVILHRQADRLLRHVLPGPLGLSSNGVARISFGWNGPAKSWTLSLEQPGQGEGRRTRGRDCMPMLMEDILSICDGTHETRRHRSVLWFGVMDGATLPDRAPWVGLQTPIDTPYGPCPAGKLRPGDMLLTEDGDYSVLLSRTQMDLPSRGSFSPVVLRAPYFGAESDILVSADQLVAISGDEVEYLFGEDTVLTEARNLTDGRAALMDLRRALTSCVALDIGVPRLIQAEDCRLLTHTNGRSSAQTFAPHTIIRGYETIPLLDMLGRTGGRSAA